MGTHVRPARPEDSDALREIERLAGERFRKIGMDAVADDEPPSVDVLTGYAVDNRAWVAVDDADTPLGYVLVDVVDDAAHVEQISVLPDHQGMGIGRLLLDHVRSWAIATHLRSITLTTFTDVPWNRPLYEHLGFRVLTDPEIGPGLRTVQATEAAHGLDPTTRVCMRLDLVD